MLESNEIDESCASPDKSLEEGRSEIPRSVKMMKTPQSLMGLKPIKPSYATFTIEEATKITNGLVMQIN